MVAAVVNETYIPYPQVVDGRCLRLSSGLRGIGLCPFYPVAVLLLLLGGCGCIGNGSSRNGPDDGAYGGTPVSSSPASVTVTYQPADGTATLLPMAAPASTALGSPAAIWLVPHPLRMMVAARIPIKDFFMFISLSLLCWTDCFIKGLFPINHLFGHASVNGDVFAIDEVVLVLT